MNCKSVECQTENEQQSGEGERETLVLGMWKGWAVRLVGRSSGLDSSPSNVSKMFLGCDAPGRGPRQVPDKGTRLDLNIRILVYPLGWAKIPSLSRDFGIKGDNC